MRRLLLLTLLVSFPCIAAESRWRGNVLLGNERWPIELTLTLDDTNATALVDLPAIHAYARPFTGSIGGGRITLERTSPTGAAMKITAALEGERLNGRWSGFGFEAPLFLTRGGEIPRHREIRGIVSSGATKLGATIVLPETQGRYPGLVFTHGGGAETRDFAISRAVFMARQGIVSIVYDKRGTGESTGDWQIASMHDLAADALAAMRHLAAHAEVREVGIYGYSQGGWIAPLSASMSPDVRFVIAGGLSAVGPMEQTVHHRTEVMRSAGFDAATIERAMQQWRRVWDSSFDRVERSLVIRELETASREPWFEASGLPASLDPAAAPQTLRDFLTFDPLPVWSRVLVPMLLYWGENDINVPVTKSRELIARALITANHADFTFRLIPDVAHELTIRRTSGSVTSQEDLRGIAQWILSRTGSSSGRSRSGE